MIGPGGAEPETSWPRVERSRRRGAKPGRSVWYGSGEHHEPSRTDEQESERLHSTEEAGELISVRTPWREGGRRVVEPLQGNMPEALNSENVFTKLQRIAVPREG